VRIVIVNSLSPEYGSTYRARNLYKACGELGYTVTYLESNTTLSAKGVVNISQEATLVGYLAASLKRAYVCFALSYDVAVIQKFTPLTLFAILVVKLRRKRLIVDWDDLDSEFQKTPLRKIILRILEHSIPPYIACIMTHSRYLMEYAKKSGARRVVMVPQVVDTALFDALPREGSPLHARLPADKVIVSYLCTMTQGGARDIEFIVRSYTIAQRSCGRLHLLLIGGGPSESHIRLLLKKHKITEYTITGLLSQEEVAQHLFHSSVCLVYMKDDRGNKMRVSLKVLEYLAMEKKVVGSFTGETKDTLADFCIEVKPASEENFARAILSVIEQDDFVNKEGREYIEKNYSFQAMKTAIKNTLENENFSR